jgi:hypothetical protein
MLSPVTFGEINNPNSFVVRDAYVLAANVCADSSICCGHEGIWVCSPDKIKYWATCSDKSAELISTESLGSPQAGYPTVVPWTGELFVPRPEHCTLVRSRLVSGSHALASREFATAGLCTAVGALGHFLLCFSSSTLQVFDSRTLEFIASVPCPGFQWSSNRLCPLESDTVFIHCAGMGITRLHAPTVAEVSRHTNRAFSSRSTRFQTDLLDVGAPGNFLLEHFDPTLGHSFADDERTPNLGLQTFIEVSRQFQSPALPAAAAVARVADGEPKLVTDAFLRNGLSHFLASFDGSQRKLERPSPIRFLGNNSRSDNTRLLGDPEARVTPLQYCSQLNMVTMPAMKRLFSTLAGATSPDAPDSSDSFEALLLRAPDQLLARLERLAGIDRKYLDFCSQQQRAQGLHTIVPPPSDFGVSQTVNQYFDDGAHPLHFETMCQLYAATAPHLLLHFVDLVQLNSTERDSQDKQLSSGSSLELSGRPLSTLLASSAPTKAKDNAQPSDSQGSSAFVSNSMRDMAAVLDAAGHLEPAPFFPLRPNFYFRALGCIPPQASSPDLLTVRASLFDRVGRSSAAVRLLLSAINTPNFDCGQVWGATISYVQSKLGGDPLSHPVSAELVTVLLQTALRSDDKRISQILSALSRKVSPIDLVGLLKIVLHPSSVVSLRPFKSHLLHILSRGSLD